MQDPQPSPRRFVLLEHTTAAGVHWDLLIERPGQERLISWRLACDPTRGVFPILAEPMPPHRKAYLDYEGPISGNRGAVRRIDRGPARCTDDARAAEAMGDDTRATLELDGLKLRGHFTIKTTQGGCMLDRSD